MWIRSQDRNMLINESYFRIYKERKEYSICSRVEVLGTYSTEEKAMKVMDMIETSILENEIANSVIDIGYWKKGIFQMPKDDEVEV